MPLAALQVRAPRPRETTVADALAAFLAESGVALGFGVLGGAITPFGRSLAKHSIRVVHARHEGGAAFAAVEAHFASARPTVVFSTTGPGTMNAMTGMAAARWEGARVLLVSGVTSVGQRGKGAFQESSPYTESPAHHVFHWTHTIEHASELPVVLRRLRAGFARPDGFVAHLSLPLDVQTSACAFAEERAATSTALAGVDAETCERVAGMLARIPMALWLGFGARAASDEVRRLAERAAMPVVCSPRAKGIFPESHPLFAGVTGFGGAPDVAEKLAHVRATLVLGTRLGELTSFWDPELVPPEGFVHVDLDRSVPGRAYPNAPTLAVQAEIGAFTRSVLDALGPRPRRNKSRSSTPDLIRTTTARHEGLVRPTALMAAIQRRIVEGSSAIVMTEAGNAFAWGTHCLRFDEPGRYRVSTGFGSMGQATAGVVGAALASGKSVAIVGDGAMLMNCEISTAVQYGAPAVWIVLNDRRYGMIEQGMRAQGWSPLATDLPHTRFVAIARAMGADGIEVGSEAELGAALDRALAATRPFVVDVAIDPDEAAPIGNRIRNLMSQGAKSSDHEESPL